MNDSQLTLFDIELGDVVAVREWTERMIPAMWTAPWDCAGGIQKGAVLSGWQCPACRVVEPNAYLLDNNHGIDPERSAAPYRRWVWRIRGLRTSK